MSRRHQDPMQISEAEFRRSTKNLDEFHNQTFPAFQRGLNDWAEVARPSTPRPTSRFASRQTFLLGGGVVAGGLALAACGSSSQNAAPASTSSTSASATPSSLTVAGVGGDKAIAVTAASLENLAVAAYTMGIQVATAGKLGAAPPAVVTFARTAKMQDIALPGEERSMHPATLLVTQKWRCAGLSLPGCAGRQPVTWRNAGPPLVPWPRLAAKDSCRMQDR